MVFYSDMMVSETLKKKKKQILFKLKHGIGMVNLYVIMLNEGTDLFDIYHCAVLKQRYYRKHDFLVVGLAESWDEAVAMISELLAESVRETGSVDIKARFTGER